MRYEDDRLASIERMLEELAQRVETLERARVGLPPRASAPAPPPPRPEDTAPADAAEPERTALASRLDRPVEIDLEDLLGGRLLAWVGGIAIVLGIVFFLVMAVSRGWIDEPTRVVLALLGSTALLGTGLWLYERQGRTQAALAAVASAIAGLYATITVATSVYDLIDPAVGLGCAALVGATAAAIAVRWDSAVVGGIGIVGALLAPVLVDAGTSGLTLLFMVVALASGVAVLVWQRWNWLATAAFAVSAPQLIAWVDSTYRENLGLTLIVLLAFWALYVVAALGYELRARSVERLPTASWLLLLANVLLVAGTGWTILDDLGHDEAATAWVVGMALMHIALGAWALGQAINREIGALLIAAGMGLSAIGFALALSGPALVAGWALHAVLLAYIASRASTEPRAFGSDAERASVGAVVFLGITIVHTLIFEAPLSALVSGVDDLADAAVAVALVAGAAFGCARFLPDAVRARPFLHGLAAAALVYLGSVVIVDLWGTDADGGRRQTGQLVLSVFWALTGLAATVYGLVRDDRRARLAGLALLMLAVAKVFLYDLAALDAGYRVVSFIGLGLLLLAGAFAYQRVRVTVQEGQPE